MTRVHVVLYAALVLAPSTLYAQEPNAPLVKQTPTAVKAAPAMLDSARVCKLMQTGLQAALVAMAAAAKDEQPAGGNNKPAAQPADKAKDAKGATSIKC